MCFVVISGNTEIPARNLYNHIQKLSQSDPDEEMTAMEQEFSVSAATPSVDSLSELLRKSL